MPESDLEKAIKETDKNIDLIVAHKEHINSIFGEPKESDQKGEREFQVEMLRLQLKYDDLGLLRP